MRSCPEDLASIHPRPRSGTAVGRRQSQHGRFHVLAADTVERSQDLARRTLYDKLAVVCLLAGRAPWRSTYSRLSDLWPSDKRKATRAAQKERPRSKDEKARPQSARGWGQRCAPVNQPRPPARVPGTARNDKGPAPSCERSEACSWRASYDCPEARSSNAHRLANQLQLSTRVPLT